MWKNIKSKIQHNKGSLVRNLKIPTLRSDYMYHCMVFNSYQWRVVLSHYAHYMNHNKKCCIVHVDKLNTKDIMYFGGWWTKLKDYEGKYSTKEESQLINIENLFLSEVIKREIKLNFLLS